MTISALVLSLVSCGGGTSSSSSISNTSYGVAQKGPFSIGSKVVITEIDSTGVSTGNSIETQVISSNGQFPFDPINASFYRMKATGVAFDESTGTRYNGPISLTAITDNVQSSSINILTHWQSYRIDKLLSKGNSLKSSIEQAHNELTKLFGIYHFNSLDITASSSSNDQDNAMLLLLSGALMEASTRYDEKAQTIINEIGADFADDGQLNEVGDDWFIRLQALIKDNPKLHAQKYAEAISNKLGYNVSFDKKLPSVIPLASRPVANVPPELLAKPSEVITLDASASHDSGNIINFTWFRVDQQTQYDVQVSDRFSATPTITVPDEATVLAAPNQEVSLLYAVVVTDEDKLTHTGVVKVTIRISPPFNNPPVANAGLDQVNVLSEEVVTLDGSGTDTDGTVETYKWVQNGTPQVNLIGGNAIPSPSFKAPSVSSTPITLTFDLIVTDNNGATSNVDSVNIVVNPTVVTNVRPTAQNLTFNLPLSGYGSVYIDLIGDDQDGDNANLVYEILSIPSASNGTLDYPIGDIPRNENSLIYDSYGGADSFTYRVRDEQGLTSNVATVEFVECFIDRPFATAGTNRDVYSGSEVTLIGNGLADFSCDNGDNINFLDYEGYNWTYVGANPDTVPPIEIILDTSYPNSNQFPTFIAPTVNEIRTLTFELTVSDSDAVPELSEPVSMTVTVYPTGATLPTNQPPTTTVHDDVIVFGNGASVSIRIAERDPDGDNQGITYSIVTDPVNGQFTQTDISMGSVTYWYMPNYPVEINDSFSYIATDQDGLSTAPITVNITRITEPSTNTPPVLNDQNITVSPFTDFSNRRYLFQFTRDVIIFDEDQIDIRYIEVSRDETNGVDFSFQSYGFLRANNSSTSTPGSGEFVLKAVDKYGRESADATFTIEFTP